jgi:hypothetical protein
MRSLYHDHLANDCLLAYQGIKTCTVVPLCHEDRLIPIMQYSNNSVHHHATLVLADDNITQADLSGVFHHYAITISDQWAHAMAGYPQATLLACRAHNL